MKKWRVALRMKSPFDPGRYLSRKFLAWVVVCALATALVCVGRISSEAWAWAVIWTTGAYIGANAAQKFSEAKKRDKDAH